MKRHPAFQDLSRDHFSGLLACLHVERAHEGHPSAPPGRKAVDAFRRLWHAELCHHFDEEDANLDSVLEKAGAEYLLEALRQDHADIRRMVADQDASNAVAGWAAVAVRLRLHIRWEEDELFPWMQDNLDDTSLQALLEASVAYRTQARGPESVHEPRP